VTSPAQDTVRFHQVSQDQIRVHRVTSPAQDTVRFLQVSQDVTYFRHVCYHPVSQVMISDHMMTSPAQDAFIKLVKIRVHSLPARMAGNQFLGSLKGLEIRSLVAMGHKITNVPLIMKIWEIICCFWRQIIL
jgi:hypothetical protein